MSDNAIVTITRQSGYQFLVDFGPNIATMLADEPEPLGQGSGPAPNHMLLAAVANCLSASLVFALQKFKQDPGALTATAMPVIAVPMPGRPSVATTVRSKAAMTAGMEARLSTARNGMARAMTPGSCPVTCISGLVVL